MIHCKENHVFDGLRNGEFKTNYEYPDNRITCKFVGFVDFSDGIAAWEFEKELEQLMNKYERKGILGKK